MGSEDYLKQARQLADAIASSHGGTVGYILLGSDYNNQPVFLSERDLDNHGYVVGLTGTGKTVGLLGILHALIEQGWGGAVVIDPHGDMTYDLLELLPPSVAERVILFDPVEQQEFPLGLNLFDVPDPKRIEVSADWAVTALKKAISPDGSWPMTADRVARHLFFALAPQGGTLLEVPKFLTRPGLQDSLLPLHLSPSQANLRLLARNL